MADSPPTPALPPPTGVGGHLRYTHAVYHWLRAWRRRLATLDSELRAAVRSRDTALESLGAAARALVAAGGPLAGFARTVESLETEQADLDRHRAEALAALQAAEAEGRRAVEALLARVEALRAEAAPVERRLAEARRAWAELERERERQETRRRQSQTRGERAARRAETATADPEQRARDAEEVAAAEAEAGEALAALGGLEAELERQRSPLAELTAEAAALADRIRLLQAEQEEARTAAERRVEALRAAGESVVARAGQVRQRRRAALIDLGREVLRRGLEAAALDEPRAAAVAALERCEALRRDRSLLVDERATVDLRPFWRTVRAGVAALLALLVLLVLAL